MNVLASLLYTFEMYLVKDVYMKKIKFSTMKGRL